MQVEASFADLSSNPLELHMSRASPGRYALHEFAKNVFDLAATDAAGASLAVTHTAPHQWVVTTHPSSVRVTYRVFGDRTDGTYLSIDPTHAHINMPAAVMWARGLETRPVNVRFEPPAGSNWRVATQLFPGADAQTFTAPNLQYLMDSPAEFSAYSLREFVVDGHAFRFALHHTGTEAEEDSFVADVQKIVRTEEQVFGEFPNYEPGNYTFIVDYLPYADEDGMEHRNSTVITSSTNLRNAHEPLLDTVAHEFFHNWNVERIRPKSIEPFDLERANMSGELWLAEGFTEYYGPLTLARAGLASVASTLSRMLGFITSVALSPAHVLRSAEAMSQMAPFTDGGTPIDRTNFANTVTSYYPFGAAIALAMDLSLRERTDGRIGLDDYMRAMWTRYGKPGGAREGYVDRPYTMADAESALAGVSGDRAFARDFVARYIEGHDVADYATLLTPAGLVLRRQFPGRASWGQVRIEARGGAARVSQPILSDAPAYRAGIDMGDTIRTIDGARIATSEDVAAVVARHKPGETMQVQYVDRTNVPKTVAVTLVEDPGLELVAVESSGGTLTAAQRAFRNHWLGPQ